MNQRILNYNYSHQNSPWPFAQSHLHELSPWHGHDAFPQVALHSTLGHSADGTGENVKTPVESVSTKSKSNTTQRSNISDLLVLPRPSRFCARGNGIIWHVHSKAYRGRHHNYADRYFSRKSNRVQDADQTSIRGHLIPVGIMERSVTGTGPEHRPTLQSGRHGQLLFGAANWSSLRNR